MSTKGANANSIQARHNKRRQKRIRQQRIRRYTFFTFLGLLAVLAVMFFTPFFNIKAVTVTGNSKLTYEQILEKTGDLTGRNLFRTGEHGIKKSLSKLAYIDKVSIKKKPFPPTVIINVREHQPICQIWSDNVFIIIDQNGKILEKLLEQQAGIPTLEGISVLSANEGEQIKLNDEDDQKIIMSCLSYIEKSGILGDITVMSFADMTDITFNYQSRLDVICGTHIDFQRKLALFKEAVNSSKLTENSRGTINLSTTGKAIYTP